MFEETKNEHTLEYVHLSGGMFIKYDLTQNSFMWAWNHMLSQRYRSSYVLKKSFV